MADVSSSKKVISKGATFSTPDDGQVVQITKDDIQNDQKISVVDEEAMEKVFGRKEIANSPVAIYCIAGMLRRGKSFFLDLAIRYLMFKVGMKSGSWLDDKTAKINEGFDWRGGAVAHTKGILIWNEPFWIETAQHGKVAVFLMDTQGVGDDSSSPRTDANLFSLASLLSSYLIFNMKDVMNRRDLNQLKTFTDFGRKLKIKEQEVDQTLLFLMRDWQDPEFDYGFEGGKGHLDKTFKEATEASKHYKYLCENIKRSFKDVKCALLPHPGKKFARMKTTPTLGDVDDDFLDEVDKLLDNMFSNICVKQIGDNPLKGTDVINQAITFSKHMKTDIDADTLFEVVSHSFLANLISRCEERFAAETKSLGKECRTNDQLHKFHEQVIWGVLMHYDKQPKVAPDELMEKCRGLLLKSLEDRFFILENMNAVNEQDVQVVYRALVNDALANSDDYLSVFFSPRTPKDVLNNRQFEETTAINFDRASKLFDDTAKTNRLSSEIFQQYGKKLKNELKLQKELCKSMNFIFAYEVEKEILQAKTYATERFMEGYKKGGYPQEEYDEWFKKLEEESLTKYESANVNKSLHEFQSGKIKLKEKLSEITLIYKEAIKIELAAKDAGQNATQLLSKKKIEFKQQISMDSLRDTSKEKRLEKYQKVREGLLSQIEQSLKNDCETLISDLIKNLIAEKENDLKVLQDKFRLKLLTTKIEVAKKLNAHLTSERKHLFWEKNTTLNVETRLGQLESEKDKSIESFNKAAQGVEGTRLDLVTATRESLNEFLNHSTEIAKSQTAKQDVLDQEAAERVQTIFIMRYTEEMNEMHKNATVRKAKRKEVCDRFVNEFKVEIEKKFESSTTTTDVMQKFQDKIESDYRQWRILNKFHKKYFPRQMGRWDEIVLSIKKTFRGLFEFGTLSAPKFPTEWVLPTEFGEKRAKFLNLDAIKRSSKKK